MTLPEFISLARDRFSCRSYSDKPVDRDLLAGILEAARLAPSACNRQPWRFIVIESKEMRKVVHQAYRRDFILPVPVFIIACGVHSEAWHRAADAKDHTDIDVAIAVEHICLAAAAAGLGSCWICNFEPAALAPLGLPEGTEPIAIIPVGHPAPATEPTPKKRKATADICTFIS